MIIYGKKNQHILEDDVFNNIVNEGYSIPSIREKESWEYIVFKDSFKEKFITFLEHEKEALKYSPLKFENISEAINKIKASDIFVIILNPFPKSEPDYNYCRSILDLQLIGASVQKMIETAQKNNISAHWIFNILHFSNSIERFLETENEIISGLSLSFS